MTDVKWPWYWDRGDRPIPSISYMVGKTPIEITANNEEIIFIFSDGTACKFYHDQCCCESVTVDDVNGDWADLIGVPLLVADEREGDTGEGDWGDTFTWTFYTFRSINGSVDVKWYGTSNGYYSESVDFTSGVVV